MFPHTLTKSSHRCLESLQMLSLALLSANRHLWMQTAICFLFIQTRVELLEEGHKSGKIVQREVCVEAWGIVLLWRNRSCLANAVTGMTKAYQPTDFDSAPFLADLFEKVSASTCAIKNQHPPPLGVRWCRSASVLAVSSLRISSYYEADLLLMNNT